MFVSEMLDFDGRCSVRSDNQQIAEVGATPLDEVGTLYSSTDPGSGMGRSSMAMPFVARAWPRAVRRSRSEVAAAYVP